MTENSSGGCGGGGASRGADRSALTHHRVRHQRCENSACLLVHSGCRGSCERRCWPSRPHGERLAERVRELFWHHDVRTFRILRSCACSSQVSPHHLHLLLKYTPHHARGSHFERHRARATILRCCAISKRQAVDPRLSVSQIMGAMSLAFKFFTSCTLKKPVARNRSSLQASLHDTLAWSSLTCHKGEQRSPRESLWASTFPRFPPSRGVTALKSRGHVTIGVLQPGPPCEAWRHDKNAPPARRGAQTSSEIGTDQRVVP